MKSDLESAWLKANQHDQPMTQVIDQVSLDSALNWIENSEVYPKVIWRSRNKQKTLFGMGIGPQNNSKRFVVKGFDISEPQWPFFPSEMSWTPQFLIEWTPDSVVFHSTESGHTWTPPDGEPLNEEDHLPQHSQWVQNIEECKQLFKKSGLQKIVLARQSKCSIPNPWKAFKDLMEQQTSRYHFLFMPNQSACFFGASPEKLFSIKGSVLQTEALAGTSAIHQSNETDDKSAKELLSSSKDQWEHQLVLNYLTSQLKNISINHKYFPQEVIRLTNVQHLRTRTTVTLRNNTSLLDVLNRLHPTPAVCGFPTEEARQHISTSEPFHRGWYAGTLGFVEEDSADFTVLIRSALWINGQGFTWSGAGIVSQSDPLLEWMEINNKAKQFLDTTL